jgi:CrcB protein
VIEAILLVLLGGAIGSVWRYSWSGFIAKRIGEIFPFGTLGVNLIGSLLIGLAAGYSRPDLPHAYADVVREFVMAGLCGGLTTFSSFSLQSFHLLREKRFWMALANIIFSTALCIMTVAAGWWLATLISG